MHKCIVVAGIGTGIGKTFISSILTEAMEADYWKPVQAGNLDETDTDTVRSLVSNSKSFFHREVYRLSQPMSPHAAAKIDKTEIDLHKLDIPEIYNTLIIEPPGGLMVPLNDRQLNTDLLKKWNKPVVLVSKNYLGSINHTLLSIEVLKHHNIQIKGIIFNGERNIETEEVIIGYSKIKCICRIDEQSVIDQSVVRSLAKEWNENLQTLFQ